MASSSAGGAPELPVDQPSDQPGVRSEGLVARTKALGDAVIFRHTLFSLPFALAAVLIETGGRPPLAKLAWILLAAAAARNAANALNRVVDR